MLECNTCKADLSPSNPADSRRRHVCKAAALAAAGVGGSSSSNKQARQEEEVEVDCIGQQQPPKKKKMTAFTVTPAQEKQFPGLLAIHLIKEELPYTKAKCPVLR